MATGQGTFRGPSLSATGWPRLAAGATSPTYPDHAALRNATPPLGSDAAVTESALLW